MFLRKLCKGKTLKGVKLVDGLLKYKQSRVYMPQGKLRLLVLKRNIIVPSPAIDKKKPP
jgi:hypothetical protein